MSERELGRVAAMVPVRRKGALVALSAVVCTAVATASWAGTEATPIRVRDNPKVEEADPTSHGAWLGWTQNSKDDLGHYDFYVQRGTQARVKVNAAKTEGFGGGIVGRNVYYLQRFGDRDPRINRFDLKTGHRVQLPPKVNHNHQGGLWHGVRGHVTVSGEWLLYSGFIEPATEWDYSTWTVMLYNRVNHKLWTVVSAPSDNDNYEAGQVNGKYATFWTDARYGGSAVYRYNIETKRTVKLSQPSVGGPYDPAVGSDGTVYYFVFDTPADGPRTYELVRQPIGAPAEVVTTLTTEAGDVPQDTFVRDRVDGSRVVFFSWKGDVYKLVDGPPTGSARQR